jgi:hypothetical protein
VGPKNTLPVPQPVFEDIRVVDDICEKLAVETTLVPAQQPNPGWFRSGGDRRINRQGRPRKSKTPLTVNSSGAVNRAHRTDRVKSFFVPAGELHCLLQQRKPALIAKLPIDFIVVDCRVDGQRNGLHYVIRSEAFSTIQKGSAIPEYTPGRGGLVRFDLPDE